MGSWEFYTRNGPFHHWPLLTVFSSRHNLYSSSQLSPAEDPTCLHADNADTPVSLFTWTYPAPLLQAAATWTPLGSSRHVPWNNDLGPLDNEIQGFDVAMIFFLKLGWWNESSHMVMFPRTYGWPSPWKEVWPKDSQRRAPSRLEPKAVIPLPESETETKALRAINFRCYSINLQIKYGLCNIDHKPEHLITQL